MSCRERCLPSHGDVSSESIMLLGKLKRTLKAKCGRRTERNASCKTGWVGKGQRGVLTREERVPTTRDSSPVITKGIFAGGKERHGKNGTEITGGRMEKRNAS